MVLKARTMTVEQFDQYAQLPQNRDKLLEYIGGKVVAVVSNPRSSKIGARIGTFIGLYLLEHDIGHATGADGGYMVSGERYIPDAAFISYARQPDLTAVEGYNPLPPDLAVEVLSPSNTAEEIETKITNYLKAGTTVWVLDADEQQVRVHAPGQEPRTIGLDGTLDGGEVLPGFTLPVRDIFSRRIK